MWCFLRTTRYSNSEVSDIVAEIINTKSSEVYIETTALESKIDQLFYELYGLTAEEIKIIETKN